MIDNERKEEGSLIKYLDDKTSIYATKSDPHYLYVYLESVYGKIEKLEQGYEYLKKLVSVYKAKDYNYRILKLISEKLPSFITREICLIAVKNSGANLEYVPKEYLDYDMCLSAVENDGRAIEYIPKEHLDYKMCLSAVKSYGGAIKYVPEQYITEDFVEKVIGLNPESLSYIPMEYLSEERCFELVKENVENFKYIPSEFKSERIVAFVASKMPKLVLHLNNDTLEKQCFFHIVKNAPCALPEINTEKNEIVVPKSEKAVLYDMSGEEGSINTVYYISDIHLEHQLDIAGKSLYDIKSLIAQKVEELFSDITERDYSSDILLVGGDVADNKLLAELFYTELGEKWGGRIIYVLGNHELWDNSCGGNNICSIDETIEEYRSIIEKYTSFNMLLENELLIVYKRSDWKRGKFFKLSEANILKTANDELSEVCNRSTLLILGGIGFSGRNAIYNADSGIYRQAVSREEEINRSRRFKAIYDKVLACAANIPVIVLTHMPMKDWAEGDYNPNWIYINGHTHFNTIIRESDGTTVLSDNQVGYVPQKWHLNGFYIDKRIYDPFKDYRDGTYDMNKEEYIQFNRGRGIEIYGVKPLTDKLRLIKCGEYYMFLQYNNKGKLQILNGGKPKLLDRKIEYYEEKFRLYISNVLKMLSPYQKALKAISDEVKKFGGVGTIHGTIVDIDYLNHIYLNPLDGKITPYYAVDIRYKLIYSNVAELFANSPFRYFIEDRKMVAKYIKLIEDKKLAILSNSDCDTEKRIIPQVVLETDMYRQSYIMKSFQYIFDKKVLRRWDDTILNYDSNKEQKLLRGDDSNQ